MNKIKCIKKPIVVEAIEITKEFIDKCPTFIEKNYIKKVDDKTIAIPTMEGILEAKIGDFIIIGVRKECYPIKREIFFETYDIIKEVNDEDK